jgi:hypothetical protein
MRARDLLRLFALLVFLIAGCAHGTAVGRTGGALAGDVVTRAEGFSDRPAWADADRPFVRQGDRVSVVGYVAIRGDQRAEAGFRAADSYARAELVRFLSVRVVSVLEDTLKSGEPGKITERIETTASSLIDAIEPSQRYWEKRKDGGEERLHIYSRLDLDAAAVARLFERAVSGTPDLRTPLADLLATLRARWDRLADLGEARTGDDLLPAGVFTPSWAKAGDRQTDAAFEMVCHGLAENSKTARALAQARCNEKLCRMFGVQITARSKVVENLDGVKAESEVSEQCAEVRVVARQTREHAGECGPRGCVEWILQTYPRSAYEEEKKRLDKPTIIRQQVVIKEGDKTYRDPAACEASLRAYGAVKGLAAPAFEQRAQHLGKALHVCQDIDSRDSGLFTSLDRLLTLPLASFAGGVDDRSRETVGVRGSYAFAGKEWIDSLQTQRFITDRITSVLGLVTDAITPMRLFDLAREGGDAAAVDAVVREVVKIPFSITPTSAHHRASIHLIAIDELTARGIPYSRRYADFLVQGAEKTRLTCTEAGRDVLEYLGADHEWSEREWQVGLTLLRATPENLVHICLSALFNKQPHTGTRERRLDQIIGMILSGEVRQGDAAAGFGSLLKSLPVPEQMDLYLRYRSKLSGSAEARTNLARNVLRTTMRVGGRSPDQSIRCEDVPAKVAPILADVPQATADDTGLCECVQSGELSTSARTAAVGLLSRYSSRSCSGVR